MLQTHPHLRPSMRFLFVRPEFCPSGDLSTPKIRLSSDSASRRTPLPLAKSSRYRATSGLSPYRTCAHRAHSCGAGTCSPAPVFIGPPPARCRGADSRARRGTGDWYRPTLKWDTLPNCHCEEAAGRRGALSAKREEVPLGCNLAGPGCIVGKLPAKS